MTSNRSFATIFALIIFTGITGASISTASAQSAYGAYYAQCPAPYSVPGYRSYVYDTGRGWAGYGNAVVYMYPQTAKYYPRAKRVTSWR